MGYFSNGTEGDMYQQQWCARCVHEDHDRGCAVMLAHVLHSYDECNKDDSILHLLIPREGAYNGKCRMFWERGRGGPSGPGEPLPKHLTVVRAA